MKKIKHYLVLFCLVAASCKKESVTHTNDAATNKVTFNVGFSQTIVDFGTTTLAKTRSLKVPGATTRTLAQQVDVIYYGVYDATGKGLHIITQHSSDANFGSYSDYLKPGNYTIVVAAGKTGVLLGTANFGASASTLSTDVISCGASLTGPYWNPFTQDAFFQKQTLTVGTTATSMSFNLSRITSKLVININDAIPTTASAIQAGLNSVSNRFSIGSGAPVPYDNTSQGSSDELSNYFTSADFGTTNYQLSSFFLYSGSPFSILIYVSGQASNNYAQVAGKSIPNVTAVVNKETLLSGDLFGGNGLTASGGFQPVLDPTWSGTTTITF